MTTHTWKSNAAGQLYDPTNYVDGLPFEPGDTLVFDGSTPSWTGALVTGTYLFNESAGGNGLFLYGGTLDGSSTIAESGSGQMLIHSRGEFINDGTLEAGTTAAAGSVELISTYDGGVAAGVTNNGQITVQDGSVLRLFPDSATTYANNGTITVTGGSGLVVSDYYGYEQGNGDSFINAGLISVSGLEGGSASYATFGVAYSGSGILSVQGEASSNPSYNIAKFEGPASGDFDVGSGELQFNGDGAVQGTINFEDNDGLLHVLTTLEEPIPYLPLQATINHFQAGDQIWLDGNVFCQSFAYDPTSHDLDLYAGSTDQTQLVAQITLAGEYTQSDFQVSSPGSVDGVGASALGTALITTTNSLNGTLYVAPGGSFSGDNGNPILVTQGSATITTGTGASTVYLAGGNNHVQAQGNDTIVSSTGNDLVFASSPVHDQAGSTGALTFVSAGYSTVTGGGEAMTVFGGSGGGDVVYGGTGLTEFIGSGGTGSDFIGGQGAEIVFGGSGGGSISGGAAGGFIYGADAATTIYGGTGNSTITAANGNTVLLNGAASNLVAAGAGNVTLVGGGSTGNNSVFGGSGADQLAGGAGADFFRAGTGAATVTGGGGANLFAFDDGSAGGSTLITDFHNGIDHLTLQGYGSNAVTAALGSATVAGGSTFLSLQDGTHITLAGVTNLTAASFI